MHQDSNRHFRVMIIVAILFYSLLGTAQTPATASNTDVKSKAAVPSAPDTLTLTNGDKLTGKFVRAVGATVTFHSDVLGDINLGWDKIRELNTSRDVVMLPVGQRITRKTDDRQIARGNLSVANKEVTIQSANGASHGLPTDKVAVLLEAKVFEQELHETPGFFSDWNGNITAGATLVTATQNSETFSGGVSLVRAVPDVSFLPARSKTSLGFAGSYGKITQPQAVGSLPDVKTEIFHGGLEQDDYFSTRFFALGQAAFDRNYAQGLALQQIYGGGIGWTALKNAQQQLDLKATIQFERQSFLSSSSTSARDLIGSTYTMQYMRKLPLKMVLNQQVLIIPAYNNLAASSASENDMLALPVYKRLSVTLGTLDSYLYNPPNATAPNPINKRNSFQFTTGVSYTLR